MACIVCSGKLVQKRGRDGEDEDLYCGQCGLLYEFDPDLEDMLLGRVGKGLTTRQAIHIIKKLREDPTNKE